MIDLKKLEEKFEAFFEQETEETFNKWLDEKRKREAMALLGKGHTEQIDSDYPTEFVLPLKQSIVELCDQDNCKLFGDTQYASAA